VAAGGIKAKHLREGEEGSADPSYLVRVRSYLLSCPSRPRGTYPTDLRKHVLIYGGFHPSVAVSILAIYEDSPRSREIRLVLADRSSIFSLSLSF